MIAMNSLHSVQASQERHPSISFTVTTCRRLDLFMKTMDSFYGKCLDHDLLTEFVCSDDSSSDRDRDIMERRFPHFRFLWNSNTGHAQSLSRLISEVTTDYFLHYEDDWFLLEPGCHISNALDILKANSSIRSVSLNWIRGRHRISPSGVGFCLHRYLSDAKTLDRKFGMPAWPGFTLNPSIHETRAVRATGPYPIRPFHEWCFSYAFLKRGFRTAFMDRKIIQHCGKVSAYEINGTSR